MLMFLNKVKYHWKCGRHSNIPACCVLWFIGPWRIALRVPRLWSIFYDSPYVRCPLCRFTHRWNKIKECECEIWLLTLNVKMGMLMSPSKIWEWMNNNMFKTVFVLTFISDFWANWYSYAIVHDWIILQAFLGAVLPFINLPGVLFFIDQKDLGVRLKLCGIASLGMVFGSTMMLLMIRSGWGVGVDAIP